MPRIHHSINNKLTFCHTGVFGKSHCEEQQDFSPGRSHGQRGPKNGRLHSNDDQKEVRPLHRVHHCAPSAHHHGLGQGPRDGRRTGGGACYACRAAGRSKLDIRRNGPPSGTQRLKLFAAKKLFGASIRNYSLLKTK